MQKSDTTILSTRPLSEVIINEASNAGVVIETTSLIETASLINDEISSWIDELADGKHTVIFTSMNAVEAVTETLVNKKPDWKIYCTGNSTAELVTGFFGKEKLLATANSASELAASIIGNGDKDVIFFCGHRRRDELPELLSNASINLKEIIVYSTTLKSEVIPKNYDGILFFSPSAVESYFLNNKISMETVVFAIGKTTASAVKQYCNNKLVIAERAGKEALVRKAVGYFVGDVSRET